MPPAEDKSTKHQVRINTTDMQVRVIGRLLGHRYGATIDVLGGSTAWDGETPLAEPKRPDDEGRRKDKSECPGCKNGVMKLIKGGWGWAKDLLGIDRVDPDIAVERKTLCLACPKNCYDFGICRDDWDDGRADKDQGCGCVLALKVLQASEECPHKVWPKVKDAPKRGRN